MTEHARVARAIATACGALAAAVGLLVIASWLTGRQQLLALLPGWPTTVANTGFMLVCCGAALALLSGLVSCPFSRPAARALSGIVLAVSLATALEYVFSVDLRLDQLLARASPSPGMPIPGRPSPQAAASFFALGSALILLSARRPAFRRQSPRLALVASTVAVLAILGHLFLPPNEASQVWPHNQLAILSAVMVLLLGAGVAAARPNEGIAKMLAEEGAGGAAARTLLLGLALLAPVIVLIAVGARLAWYSHATGAAGIVFAGLSEAVMFIFMTVKEIDRLDAIRRRHEERIGELIEQASDGIFVADIDGKYTDVNEAGARMLGYKREEILGKTILDLIPAEDAARLWSTRTELLAGHVQVSEWSLKKADGSFLPVEVSAKILADGRWQGIARDITERQRAQRLREAVISMTSHELGNPLSTVSLALNMLAGDEDHPLEARQKEIVELARTSARRMSRLIADFLTVEKLATGTLAFRLEDFDLRELVEEACVSMAHLGAESRVEVRFDPSSARAVVRADPDRITQVVVNLLSNAIKFTPSGGRVDVKVSLLDGRARVTVADEGPGIPDEFRSRIFGRFERASKSMKEGSGLGLNISKSIVEALGGRIGYESRPKGGTVFFFELRLLGALAPAQSLPKAK